MSNRNNDLARVHESIDAYCAAHHDFAFDPASPVVRLHEPTFSAAEINAAVDCMLSTNVTMGAKVKGFEREYADAFGWRHGVMVNSGSSANLLAVAAVANPATKDGLKPGDEVIVPALSWSTTVWPLVQCGLVPVIVDIDRRTMNIDPAEVERAIGPKTRALMIVPVYGNACDMDALIDICNRHSLILIEDCCESMGTTYRGKPVGSFGRVGTFSFYYSHHITTFEGGICVTDDDEFAESMRILRAHGWVRETENRERYHAQYPDIDRRFLFVNVGYNLRPTEMQGAVGSIQLPKLQGFLERRRANAAWFADRLSRFGDFFEFQEQTPDSEHAWFGFTIKVKQGAPFAVADITRALNAANIETRPIICGNIARQPAMKLFEHRAVGSLANSDFIMQRAFSFGNHQGIDERARAYVADTIEEFIRKL
ncbi:MAG TPA: DegT/DnrJ/EryC1/StrS family aminotransferase [Azospirillaceae bacterium]|nr:DegT/DnrJ/EryC1/StrS family aminotransferase [Azospirillaceae bacterium]